MSKTRLRSLTINNSKACPKCGQIKPISEFGSGKSNKDGLASYCKICANAISKKHQQANPEKARASTKKWQKANPEKVAAYALANRAKNAALKKIWLAANPGYHNARYAANPAKGRLASTKRRAQKLDNGVFKVSANELKRLYASPCAYCGAPSKHIDHIIPIARGGTHSIGNLVGACAKCNFSKGAKFITEWKKWNLKNEPGEY